MAAAAAAARPRPPARHGVVFVVACLFVIILFLLFCFYYFVFMSLLSFADCCDRRFTLETETREYGGSGGRSAPKASFRPRRCFCCCLFVCYYFVFIILFLFVGFQRFCLLISASLLRLPLLSKHKEKRGADGKEGGKWSGAGRAPRPAREKRG